MRIPKPTVRITPKGFTFNAACMQLMPDVQYVQFLHDFKNSRLFAAECGANDRDKAPWRLNCVSRKIGLKNVMWPRFYKFICDEMRWIHGNEYTVPAILQEFEERRVIFFDLAGNKEVSPIWNLKLSDLMPAGVDDEMLEELPDSDITQSTSGCSVTYVSENDKAFWYTLDKHMDESEFALKVRDKRGYIISAGDKPVGIMRYNLFWDNTPFLTLIYIEESHQGKGFGKQAMLHWEGEMRSLGYKMVMTSTQVNEQAQHFYRKLGYADRGCLILDNTPCEQPQEMFMIKVL